MPVYAKTRIATTPSGYLHLGNILAFAITGTLARKHGATILLRIDDLDRARANRLYVQDIFDTLDFLQLPYDEGPRDINDFEANYSQVHRMDQYRRALDKLCNDDLVYACTCSRKQINNCACYTKHIPLTTPGASWRLITNNDVIAVRDYDGNTIQAALPDDMKNFIIKKKDGFPAYQLTSVIDDLFYGVDLVVRGEDLWPSTLAQHTLASALGKADDFGAISFYHHPLMMDASGQKLSKSAGATSIKYLRESGKTPAEIWGLIAAIAGEVNISIWQTPGGTAII